MDVKEKKRIIKRDNINFTIRFNNPYISFSLKVERKIIAINFLSNNSHLKGDSRLFYLEI